MVEHKNVTEQKHVFENIYSGDKLKRFGFHITPDKLIRFLRDRRLQKALNYLKREYNTEVKNWNVLTVCGGVGGEGIFFLRSGFSEVTVSDFSSNSLLIAKEFDIRLKTLQLNAEALDIPDNSYDLVVVQDGLHHLPRPSLGMNEMLRVAKIGIIVIEPYNSAIGNFIGTEWETNDGSINYVYRWDRKMVEQTVKSYLLKGFSKIRVFRLWDHNLAVGRIARFFPTRVRLAIVKSIYVLLTPLNFSGNMMVAVVTKK